MDSFGEIIRKLRHEKKLPLRTVAAYLDIDQAILSKIERGQRSASRKQVIRLAGFFKVMDSDLLVSWLSDKLADEVAEEEIALKALEVAEQKIEYLSFKRFDRILIQNMLKEQLMKFDKISKAWIYGSFSRGDDGPKSDIDLALQTDPTFSYFDLAEVQHVLEQSVKRKVDVGFFDAIKPYIMENIKPDLRLIYER